MKFTNLPIQINHVQSNRNTQKQSQNESLQVKRNHTCSENQQTRRKKQTQQARPFFIHPQQLRMNGVIVKNAKTFVVHK